MEDFNAAFGTLDGALKTQSDAIAGKAGGEDLTAVRQEVAAARRGQLPCQARGADSMARDGKRHAQF